MKPFKDSIDIFDSQIDEVFGKKKESEMDIILKTLSMVIYENSSNTDTMELYKLLGMENFVKVISLFDGRTVKLPSADEFKENLILSLIYYYKEIKQFTWEQIKEKLPFEISGIRYGIKIKNLNNYIRQKLEELLSNFDKGEKI
jgi:hypothetical protein